MPDDEIVQFEWILVQSKAQVLQKILNRNTPRTGEILSLCSWCDRINIDDEWYEVEKAAVRLGLFKDESLPQISHGMCEDCFQRVSKEFRE